MCSILVGRHSSRVMLLTPQVALAVLKQKGREGERDGEKKEGGGQGMST